nr:rhodanese-like domain-containing protein [Candidatus Magnetococcus massalia]CRH08253.1 Thiosulfate sulfurtransferase [Candidatus Magnetococcus massalia]
MLPSSPHSAAHKGLEHITPPEALKRVEEHDWLFIDIRTEMEHYYVGHPIGVYNVPWQDYPDFAINPDFLDEIAELADSKETPIVLICRSGHRSIDAGNYLLEHGYHQVAHVDEGFEGDKDDEHRRSNVNGWRFRGLPWMQC